MLNTATSKLTSKNQATIPEIVRHQLNLKGKDSIAFDIENGTVTVRKANPLDLSFTAAVSDTLSEWSSENDEEAYRDL